LGHLDKLLGQLAKMFIAPEPQTHMLHMLGVDPSAELLTVKPLLQNEVGPQPLLATPPFNLEELTAQGTPLNVIDLGHLLENLLAMLFQRLDLGEK
jgi:hypothetical protein